MTAKSKPGRTTRHAPRRVAREIRSGAPGRRLKVALREVLADVTGRKPLPVVAAVPAAVDARAARRARA